MRVYLEAYGCSQNHGEAAELRNALHSAGHRITSDPDRADVGVLVTCGVIGSTEDRMVRRWQTISRRVPMTVVTGCLVPLRTDRFVGEGRERTTFLRIADQHRLPELLRADGRPSVPVPEGLPPADPRAATAEVVIGQGCLSHCTYCFSRLARGPLASRPLEVVVKEVREAIERGASEVRLCSLDTSCWGGDVDLGPRLPDLVEAAAGVPGTYGIRVGMASPQTLRPIATRLFESLRLPHVFRFLHLPVQSGSDRVLTAMRRGYRAEDVRRLVQEARSIVPDLMLATDVIVGFPEEEESDFDATLSLVSDLEPEIVNVTRFSPRPLTPAYRSPRVPSRVVKERSRRLTAHRLRVARARMERWIGWTGPALLVEAGRDGSTVGRLPNYLPVVLDQPLALGTEMEVRVDGARSTYLLGHVTDSAASRLGVGN